MSAVCSHLHQQRQHLSVYATWGVPAHSVVVVAAAAELVPLADLLAARCSVNLVLVLMTVLELGPELGPEHEPVLEPVLEPEPEPESEPPAPAPAPARDVAARRTFVVVLVPALLPMFDVHRLSDFELVLVPPVPSPCKTAPYWDLHKLVGLSFVERMRDGVAGFGVGAGSGVGTEAARAEAEQRAARVDVENCWVPYCQRLPSRAKRAKVQHGETKLRH